MEKNKMLIDATHPEETRVVVLRGGRVEEFDYESAARKPLRGNIYLAKVTRVEPSLQAAFVEYGGNRHGFLAFSEIHPDYYQIPFADRQALLDEEAEEEARAEQEADARAERRARRDRGGRRRHSGDRNGGDGGDFHHRNGDEPGMRDDAPVEDPSHDAAYPASGDEGHEAFAPSAEGPDAEPARAQPAHHEDQPDMRIAEHSGEVAVPPPARLEGDERAEGSDAVDAADAPHPIGLVEEVGVSEVDENGSADGPPPEQIEQVGSEDALEEVPERTRRRARQYKIQEVIKRRQIILIQVVKEERGNKGAALTTYLSLAGRYTVLMPNTGRGGGISRKITQPQDRKRLKAIAQELEVPEGMGLIIRTAGAARTKQEIKRDFEYLLRLWESVRDMTLRSTAPCLVYEEGNLIKRSLRDLYSKEIDEVLVAGDGAHQEAHDFMRMLMPSHAENVVAYNDPDPLFTRYQIERQLNAMFSPYVTLRSGGYLVINQTEALVSVDVNSGKSTREFSIEETALNTNLEAADEIARQLKLRDLAGLIVIDFIDMEEKRNNRAVERRLKDALRFDRARIQVGHISHFGLLEMSRQRLRTGVLEGSTSQCPHCQGTGIIRSTESVALAVLRAIEDHLMKGPPSSLAAITTTTVALYILNQKRGFIQEIERRYGIVVSVQASDRMQGASFAIERTAEAVAPPPRRADRAAVSMDWGFEGGDDDEAEEAVSSAAERDDEQAGEARGREGNRSRRRRRGRGRRGERGEGAVGRGAAHDDHDEDAASAHQHADHAAEERDDAPRVVRADDAPADLDDEPGDGRAARGDEDRRSEEDGEAGDGRNRNRRRRRGRRGGRSRGRGREMTGEGAQDGERTPPLPGDEQPEVSASFVPHVVWDDFPELPRRDEQVHAEAQPEPIEQVHHVASVAVVESEPYDPHRIVEQAPKIDHPAASATADEAAQPAVAVSEPAPVPVEVAATPTPAQVEPAGAAPSPERESVEEPAGPPRKGWWQRRFGG